MRELGYIEGRDYGFEVRYADGQYDHIPAQMHELVRLKPDIIVSGTMAGVLAAKKLTNTVPIVSETLIDPIGFGVAASQARPGGNVTGVMLTVEDLPTKLLGLALEVVPGANRVGLLVNPTNPTHPGFKRSLEVAARVLGVELLRRRPAPSTICTPRFSVSRASASRTVGGIQPVSSTKFSRVPSPPICQSSFRRN